MKKSPAKTGDFNLTLIFTFVNILIGAFLNKRRAGVNDELHDELKEQEKRMWICLILGILTLCLTILSYIFTEELTFRGLIPVLVFILGFLLLFNIGVNRGKIINRGIIFGALVTLIVILSAIITVALICFFGVAEKLFQPILLFFSGIGIISLFYYELTPKKLPKDFD